MSCIVIGQFCLSDPHCKMAMKLFVTRCIFFVVAVGFSLLFYLFVCLLFCPMLLSSQTSDMRKINASD